MAGKTEDFKVRISAEDKTSGTLDAINKRMAALNRQVERGRKPFEDLARNYKKFTEVTGLRKIAEGMSDVARSGFDAFRSVMRIVEPLAAITGAASIGGLVQLASKWADFGTTLLHTANRAGLSTSQLQGLQNAASLVGVSADKVGSGMTSLRDNMVNALGGLAPDVMSMMGALYGEDGIGKIHEFANDSAKALPELAERIKALRNPTLQARAATALFGGAGEAMLPFLVQGAAGIAKLNAMVDKFRLPSDAAEKLDDLSTSFALLKLAGNSFTELIAYNLAPVLGPLLDQMSAWIGKNREWIATDIGAAIKRFADYLANGIDWKAVEAGFLHVETVVENFITSLGGVLPAVKEIGAFLGGAWLASALAPIIGLTASLLGLPAAAAAALLGVSLAADAYKKVTATDTGFSSAEDDIAKRAMAVAEDENDGRVGIGEQLRNLVQWAGGRSHPELKPADDAQNETDIKQLMADGWSHEQAAGIVGNNWEESVGDSQAKELKGGPGEGLAQWSTPERKAAFLARYGHTILQGTHAEQIDFENFELHTTHKAAGDRLRQTRSAYEGASVVRQYYEMPKDPDGTQDSRRGANAVEMLSLPIDAGTASSPGAMPNGQVQVGINMSGLPSTAKTTAVQSGTGMAPLKVARTGVGLDEGVLSY